MGVTNGFLRLSPDKFAELQGDPKAFVAACQNYKDPDYLDMDKAGYELLMVLSEIDGFDDADFDDADLEDADLEDGDDMDEIEDAEDDGDVDEAGAEEDLPFPAIADVLAAGTVVHPDIDLGYGPAMLLSPETLREALPEFDTIKLEDLTQMAMGNELLVDMLMADVDEETIAEYHWPYLQSLGEFVREAVAKEMVVLRY